MWSKMSLFEVSTRVPLILSVPWVGNAGRTCPRTVELVDLYPTLVELCGLPMPAGLEGTSLASFLKNPVAPRERPAYTFLRRGQMLGASVRTERHRYTEWAGGRGGSELYDHHSDPGENRNLAANPTQAATVAALKRLLSEGAN